MNRRTHMLRLADEAARDPSASRALVEELANLAGAALQNGELSCPEGYLYAPAHCFTALAESIPVEPLPDPDRLQSLQLTATTNRAIAITIPFDVLIVAVEGWAIPQMPALSQVSAQVRTGAELESCSRDGRDLFAVRWELNGTSDFSTDGQDELLEPAAAIVGTRKNPRPLAWRLGRNNIVNVFFRNLSNLINTTPISGETAGFPITCGLTFHAINLEQP